MTEEQIKHMVDRFLSWKLPENFNPDDGISFDPIAGAAGPYPFRRTPSGTNLFDATQATEMVRYLIDGLPAPGTSLVVVDRVVFRNFPGPHADIPSAFAFTADGKEWRLSEDEIVRALNAQPIVPIPAPSKSEAVAWPSDDQIWDCVRLTFPEKIAKGLSFKRWKDGIDVDYPTSEAVSFARQLFAMGLAASPASTNAEAQFLLDRLDEFDPGDEDAERDFHGHVAPAMARLRHALGSDSSTDTAWQPIETAPKDGRRILATVLDRPQNTYVVRYLEKSWQIGPLGEWVAYPTHWMHLPTHPVPQTNTSGGK